MKKLKERRKKNCMRLSQIVYTEGDTLNETANNTTFNDFFS